MPFSHLSVSLPYWQNREPLDALRVAEAADRLGYHRLWIGEMATFDAFALATAIGRSPGRIPLCIGPLAIGVRSPATIAMGTATVAALTGRPVDIALGSSSTVVVRDWHGRRRHRTARHLEEATRIVRALLAGEKVEYDGLIERVRGFRLRLPALGPTLARSVDGPHTDAQIGRPSVGSAHARHGREQQSRPPTAPEGAATVDEAENAGPRAVAAPRGGEVVVAAFGERALEVAARCADRVVLNLVTPAQVARCVAVIREFAAAAGRPAPPVSVWVTAAFEPDAGMLVTVRRGVVGYLRAPGYDAMFTEAGFGDVVELARTGAHPRQVLAAIPNELPAAVGIFGDAETVAARLGRYRDAGADEVVIVPVTADDDPAGQRTLEALAGIRAQSAGRPEGSVDE
ncbi:LLM class flavin-dependent oxidoreductase [Nocardia aurantiaca]|uniref:LLM class flavin-dependent oxidoreductase n=1 Tax=Nocardia aurantiaca TaxID=2675850 RepID=A0A6I3L515_9NOCA|nr:LLM class flavin-dependent oxidoreductase [Nocardia aurantiaca]MTE15754.1 LLM class flavin-dependent oxidoreductase [Nocardia aurantiaca]